MRLTYPKCMSSYENGKKLSGDGGISTRNFKMFRELCGEGTLKNVVILTNMWGEVGKEELATRDIFFKPVLDKGAQLLRHTRTIESAQNILRYLINNHPLSLKIQRELTAAGSELNRELMEQAKKHQEMKEAIRTKDEETRKELEIERQKLQTEMSRVQDQSQKLASDYNEEKAKLEKRLNELTEKARIEQEKTQAEYEAQLRALRQQLEQSVTSSAAEKNRIMEQISALQRGRGGVGGLFSMIGTALDALFGMR
ncbi:hypothetical protein BD779DRAFT_1494454 [Infundibulicybe gibba]|nr:hypothetical protein BD779DRAFT_1494454 [Infundibulicybe gibba]